MKVFKLHLVLFSSNNTTVYGFMGEKKDHEYCLYIKEQVRIYGFIYPYLCMCIPMYLHFYIHITNKIMLLKLQIQEKQWDLKC